MGSLFQLRDYWSKTFTAEEFSPSAITVGDLDNQRTNDKIALGSFQGYLRILCPQGSASDKVSAEDVLYEEKFSEPILQVGCAPLQPIAPGVSQNLLAILFPRRILLTRLERHGCVDEENDRHSSTFYRSVTHYEATFEHTSYNFITGPFSRVDHHMTCVQSMDGQLSIVDHNKVLCNRFLPSNQFLLPGCMAYCPLRDTILTNNTSYFLMCYSFSNITNSVTAETKSYGDDSSEFAPGMKIAPTWAFNLGEDVVDMRVCSFSRGLLSNNSDILVLCPYTLYVLSMDGVYRTMKRLDVEASALGVYPLKTPNCHNVLIGTHSGSVNVYTDVSLNWSAKMKSGVPLSLHVATLCGTEGMILSMNSECTLSINYLGTDPAEKPVQPLESQSRTFAEMTAELQQTLQAIKLSGEDDVLLSVKGKTEPEDKLKESQHHIPTESTSPMLIYYEQDSVSEEDFSACGTLRLTLAPTCEFDVAHHIIVQIDGIEPITISPAQKEVAAVAKGETVAIPIVLSASPDKDHIIPSSVEIAVVAVFSGGSQVGATWTSRTSFFAPLFLVCRVVPPVKHTSFSMQINTEVSQPPPLTELFKEFTEQSNDVAPNVISIRYLNGADATVLVSKSAARFRLQSSTLEGLWLLASVLVQRLREYYASSSPLRLSIPDELPVVDFLAVVDTHYAVRRELADATEALRKSAEFFRAVEKRLLVRFRDRNPSPTDAISRLFNESYSLLVQHTEAVCVAKSRQRQACAMLNCCCRLVFMWMALRHPAVFQKTDGMADILRGIFTCEITADDSVGWEETTEAALTVILKVKNKKASSKKIEVSKHTETVKKILTNLFDRVKAGTGLVGEA